MNERILELARQVWPDPNISHVNHMKFAELIVRESIVDFYTRHLDTTSNEHITVQVERYVKEHFGVEESLGWVCPNCGTDRTKAVCPLGHSAEIDGRCSMILTALY